jgi:glycosyltransferase involved in cell wall biosynthesis
MAKLRLLFTQDALVNAGAERSHLAILSRFSKEIDVGFVYFYPKHDLKEAYERAGIRLFFLDIPESYHFSLAIYRLVQLIKKVKPDLLVSSLWRADIITRIASLITGVPLVGTLVNDSYAPIAWTDKKGLKYKMVYWLDRWTAGIPIHWLANAQALADSHVKTLGIKREKISVVYRGRDVPVTEPTDGEVITMEPSSRADEGSAAISRSEQEKNNKTASPDSIGIAVTGQIRNFISYGRLLERKGFQDAIYAFSEVLKKYPNCTLTIFGEGVYRRELERQILYFGLENSVFLPGKIPNPMDILISNGKQHPTPVVSEVETSDIGHPTSFHCFLFPSWYEGFSGALVEAMMAGIPIIASDIPMNLEAVTDQKSALIFPVQNTESLKDRMLWAIENPDQMEDLGNEAKKFAIERFDIEKIALQYEQTLMKIAYQIKQN